MSPRYGIAEWFGRPFLSLLPAERQQLARAALKRTDTMPLCPYRPNRSPCSKPGGVCSLQRYEKNDDGRIANMAAGDPVIVCPSRFEQGQLLGRWLAEIVGFDPEQAQMAREVPFMQAANTSKAAGKIDFIVAQDSGGEMRWYGLEVQAVYFSGRGMDSEFERLQDDEHRSPPFPNEIRRPDWRSSSAKRLLPQLQIKAPTLRRWGSKIAIAVDRPFFDAVGGASGEPSQDLNEGDVIWMVPQLAPVGAGGYELQRGHWEVLTLEDTAEKLKAARTVQRASFEQELRGKLEPLEWAAAFNE